MNKEKQLLNHPSVVSYSFRSTRELSSDFIKNYPVHSWLLTYMPKVLVDMIIFDYWMEDPEEQKHIQVLPVFPLNQIENKFLNTYPLRDEKDELVFPTAPEGSECASLATFALETRMYKERGNYYDPQTNTYPYQIGTYDLLKDQLPPILRSVRIPKVSDEIILSYLNFEHWKKLLCPTGTRTDESLNYYFPWKSDEKHSLHTKKLIEEEQYTVEERKTIFRQLMDAHLPKVLLDIIESYNNFEADLEINHKPIYLDEIQNFINKYTEMDRDGTKTMANYYILMGIRDAIKAIRKGNWFDEKFMQDDHTQFIKRWITIPFPIKTPLDYWIFFFAKKSFFTSFPGNNPRTPNITFFEHIIRHFNDMEESEIKNLGRICNGAKKLAESALIMEAKIPQRNIFYMSQEMVLSLYLHIISHLKLEHELLLKDTSNKIILEEKGIPVHLYNRCANPVLLIKALRVIGAKVHSIEFNQNSGFLIVPTEHKTGIRLLNIHQKFPILEILYGYIHSTQSKRAKNYQTQAKKLITQILETPDSSPRLYLIIGEIKKTLSQGMINDPEYLRVLKEVGMKLVSISGISWENILQAQVQSLSLEQTLALEKKNMLKTTSPEAKTPLIFTLIRQSVFEQEKIGLPASVSHLIFSYIETIFDKIDPLIQSFYSEVKSSQDPYLTYNYRVVQQNTLSSDCGYWSLFNANRFFSKMGVGLAEPFDENQLSQEFKVFKNQVNKQLGSLQLDDISPVHLAQILESMASLDSVQAMQAAAGIPAYTIVNSLRGDEQKLEPGFTFGGCLEAYKLQLAINMYQLSQYPGKILHCFFVGDDQHWHVQWLALGYGEHRYRFIHMDSFAATHTEARSATILHLMDILNNPQVYAKNIADEVIPFFEKEISKILDNNSKSGFELQKQFFQVNYPILMKFFDTFGKFHFIKKQLPVRDLAKKLVSRKPAPAVSLKPPAQLSLFQSVSKAVGNYLSNFSL